MRARARAHGTSKIRTAADLVGVASFGFRGEALPAIASISRFELDTSPADGEGTTDRRRRRSGRVAVKQSARRRGTTVSVSQLFFNTPARKKFLRSARSEWRAIVDTVGSIALTRPDVRFTLTHDGKDVLVLPPVSSLRARLSGIWGGKYAGELLDVDDVSGTVHTSGLVERPADVGTATRRVFSRSMDARCGTRASFALLRQRTARRSRPGCGRRCSSASTLPAAAVDVNVHPAKAEVRFLERWPVERAVETAVRRALGTLDASASMGGAILRRRGAEPASFLRRAATDSDAIAAPRRVADVTARCSSPADHAPSATRIQEIARDSGAVPVSPDVHRVRAAGRARSHRPAFCARARSVRRIHGVARNRSGARSAASASSDAPSRTGRSGRVRGESRVSRASSASRSKASAEARSS